MSETIFEKERQQQEVNEELDAFLASVQQELSDLKRRLAQLRSTRKKKKSKPPKLPAPFNIEKVKAEIAEVKEIIVGQNETDTLLKTHPTVEPDDGQPINKNQRPGKKALSPKEQAKLRSLESLINDVRRQVDAKRSRKPDALAIVTDPDLAATILNFYITYAVYAEFFNSMKILYQVLMAEYAENGALDDKDIGQLRSAAIARITILLCRQGWLGPKAAANRRGFRESMMKAIRRRLGHRASLEKNGQKVYPPLTALCLSGGGIRSATFGLGVIQALARRGVLDKFDYLSTVSGGGYIGSWLSAWVTREPNGIKTVQNILRRKAGELVEPPEVTHLRSFSNYMSPRTGFLSADTWTLIGVYLRNLILNWLVAVPLIAAFLLLPRLLVEFIYNGQALVGSGSPTLQAGIVTVGSSILGCLAMFAATVFRPSLSKYLPRDSIFQQRFQRDDVGSVKNMDVTVLLLCVVPIMLFAVGITSYGYWVGQSPERQHWVEEAQKFLTANRYPVLSILITLFVGLALANIFYRRNTRLEGGWDKFFGTVVIVIAIVIGSLQLSFPQELMLFNLVAFTNLIFIIGFVAARLFIWRRGRKQELKGFWDNVPIEFSISFLAASIGGTLLYAVNEWLRSMQPTPEVYATVAVPLFVGVFMAAATLFIGIGSKILDDIDREWASRLGAWLLVACLGWLAVCGVVLLGPTALQWGRNAATDWLISAGGLAGVISGAVTLIFGYYANNNGQAEKQAKGPVGKVMQIAPQIAAPVFVAFLLVVVVLGTNQLISFVGEEIEFMRYQFPPANWPSLQGAMVILIWMTILLAIGCLMGWWINVNKFSLHATTANV